MSIKSSIFAQNLKSMHRILFLFLFVFGVASGTQQEPQKVFICQGSMSECYHSKKDCKGLEYCSTQLKEITLEEAKKLGRRPCKFCCK